MDFFHASLSIYDSEQENYNRYIADIQDSTDIPSDYINPHHTFDTEQKIMHIIEHGDYPAVKEWLANAPALRGGILAADQMRQILSCRKNRRSQKASSLLHEISFAIPIPQTASASLRSSHQSSPCKASHPSHCRSGQFCHPRTHAL